LIELHDVAIGHGRALDRHRVHEWQRGDEHPAVVDRKVPREIGDREGELAEEWKARALFLIEDLDQISDRGRHRARLLPAMLRRAIGVAIRRVLGGRRYAARIDVVLMDRFGYSADRLQS